jgi:hypothetical protein
VKLAPKKTPAWNEKTDSGYSLLEELELTRGKRNWGYQTFTDQAKLQAGYEDLIAKLGPLVSQGLAAAIYTQTTDVEGEVVRKLLA